MEIKEMIKQLMKQVQENIEEIEEVTNEDFNACDASGGNFDDAYELGHDHGFQYGRRSVLNELFSEFF
jgi:flagellar biosynthesis/type III secretory pathway protein FliH